MTSATRRSAGTITPTSASPATGRSRSGSPRIQRAGSPVATRRSPGGAARPPPPADQGLSCATLARGSQGRRNAPDVRDKLRQAIHERVLVAWDRAGGCSGEVLPVDLEVAERHLRVVDRVVQEDRDVRQAAWEALRDGVLGGPALG